MITVARNVLEDVSKHVSDLAESSMMKAASKLPGYSAYEAALETLAKAAVLPKPADSGPAADARDDHGQG